LELKKVEDDKPKRYPSEVWKWKTLLLERQLQW